MEMSYTGWAGKRVLVAPLDWGLGHATRCIPIIAQLQQAGAQVWLAGSGSVAALLQHEFPQLPMLPLQGYGISYARSGLLLHLARQWPRIRQAIAAEHQWLQGQQQQHHFHAIISDNRYGLHHPQAHSILLTHQLVPALPARLGWLQPLVRRTMYGYLQQFHSIWVPDVADAQTGLSGALGHPQPMPQVPVHYVGWLTRFAPLKTAVPKRWRLLVLLSGPEPQRTLLEQQVVQQLAGVQQPIALVRGLPQNTGHTLQVPGHVTVYPHLPAAQLQSLMAEAEYVLCRGGYSTLMDAFTLQARCLVVPTPGQTEQEYLARRWAQRGAVLHQPQQRLQLAAWLHEADGHAWSLPAVPAHKALPHAGQALHPEYLKAT